MDFYAKRTVAEQAKRLPSSYQERYLNSKLDRIEIDGCEIQGYFEYSFMEEKSFYEQPYRSQDGSIEELDNYTTFLTPRLIIRYNMMGIDDYRTLMTFLKSKNAFRVTCYDEVADKRVTHEMYFAPPSMPIIYQRYLSVLGIEDYSIELIGTNQKDKTKMAGSCYIDGVLYDVYFEEDWLHFSIRNNTLYKVIYSTKLKRFIVSKDSGETALRVTDALEIGRDYVGPYENISFGEHYESVEVISP